DYGGIRIVAGGCRIGAAGQRLSGISRSYSDRTHGGGISRRYGTGVAGDLVAHIYGARPGTYFCSGDRMDGRCYHRRDRGTVAFAFGSENAGGELFRASVGEASAQARVVPDWDLERP